MSSRCQRFERIFLLIFALFRKFQPSFLHFEGHFQKNAPPARFKARGRRVRNVRAGFEAPLPFSRALF